MSKTYIHLECENCNKCLPFRPDVYIENGKKSKRLEDDLKKKCPNCKYETGEWEEWIEHGHIEPYTNCEICQSNLIEAKAIDTLKTQLSKKGGGNFNQNIGNWNVSKVTDMYRMFDSAFTFNQDIGNWNVSKVTDMGGMFYYTAFNQNIGNWNVSKVIRMDYMFKPTLSMPRSFNKIFAPSGTGIVASSILNFWKGTYKVTLKICRIDPSTGQFEHYGWYSPHFKYIQLQSLTKSIDIVPLNATGTTILNEGSLDPASNWVWDSTGHYHVGPLPAEGYVIINLTISDELIVAKVVVDFGFCCDDRGIEILIDPIDVDLNQNSFFLPFNQDIGNWNVSNVTTMKSMFNDTPFNQNIGGWNVSKVTDMGGMFDILPVILADNAQGGAPYSLLLMFVTGTYILEMRDTCGDGWNGNTWKIEGTNIEESPANPSSPWCNGGATEDVSFNFTDDMGSYLVICDGGFYQYEISWLN
ncbi:BspA family leucine-rich repeat surface protein [bacterium]|nr:BspA family leucine-rich repeat surface protein [bacterium]